MPYYALGLDGSLQNFGIAVCLVDDAGAITNVEDLVLSKTVKDKTKKKRAEDDFERFLQHIKTLRNITERYNPKVICAEIPFGSRDVRAAFAFGGVTAIAASFALDYEVITVTPTEVKLAATKNKYADKEDIIQAMYGFYPDANWITSKRPNALNVVTTGGHYLTNANEHLADAIAITIAGLNKR